MKSRRLGVMGIENPILCSGGERIHPFPPLISFSHWMEFSTINDVECIECCDFRLGYHFRCLSIRYTTLR